MAKDKQPEDKFAELAKAEAAARANGKKNVHYVYSTSSTDAKYVQWVQADAGAAGAIVHSVTIKGGHGVARGKNGIYIDTPLGVATAVSDDELEFLEKHHLFKKHKEAGFLTVSKHEVSPEKVAADLQSEDGSAPLNETKLKEVRELSEEKA